MADIVTISDYIGEFQIQSDVNTTSRFNDIRDEWDRVWIRKMLGVELGNLFLTNWDAATPTTLDARFQVIYDAFQEDWNNSIVESRGIKFFIKCVVWYYYSRTNNVDVTAGGNKSSLSQNSEQINSAMFFAKNFNQGIDTAKAIQWYCLDNSATYPEFNGQYLDHLNGLQ